ncbi:hypothetical protein [Bifidobacterium callimiconis]|uniref:Uncharacterized protein n=1 Tax=Bifidobacterium callimiconis TaxID=2306973 RepID=A0A430FBZ1_9BIFI|nr:hypothetical protein [Bifidobacterium callimiconis]RSX50365.1 hypothetical protein D2E23_1688 [Bifidobacterium callimiconis]
MSNPTTAPVASETATESAATGADPLVAALAQRVRQTIDKEGTDALYDADRDFDEFWQTSTARSDDERRLLEALSRQTKAGLVGPILASVRPGSTAVEFNNAMQSMLDQDASETEEPADGETPGKTGNGVSGNDSARQTAARITAALFLAGGANPATTNTLMARVNADTATAKAGGISDDAIRNGWLGSKRYGKPNTRWYKHDFTGSLRAYTSLGSIWLNSERRVKIHNIHRQRMDNITTLKYAAVLTALFVAFMAVFHAGLFTATPHVLMIVLCVLAVAAFAAFAVHWFKTKPYNNLNGVIALIYAVWAIYALSVVL